MQSYISHPRGIVFYHLINYLSSKFSPIDLLGKISEIIENMIFSLLFVLREIWDFRQLRKIKKIRLKYEKKIVEPFYEKVVFHTVYRWAFTRKISEVSFIKLLNLSLNVKERSIWLPLYNWLLIYDATHLRF